MNTKSEKKRKFKFNKKFKPTPIDDGDEIYPNGIFKFNITKLTAHILSNANIFPLEQIDVKDLNVVSTDHLDKTTIKKADISKPIILAEISPGRFNIIDGNHRLEKAHRDGVEKIPAYRVMAEQHLAFLTSEKAYKTYIEYWNSKIDEMD
ncbi:MAG: hypothetical protein A2583_15960 [Bdellovibrionales bacterium RIFOXYD1_FULL_53_11]|nr:MAG: hypothetical protein A2583_15960 [Bdellovibrionales bacterium RIFOXYD1_FULL_53_11]